MLSCVALLSRGELRGHTETSMGWGDETTDPDRKLRRCDAEGHTPLWGVRTVDSRGETEMSYDPVVVEGDPAVYQRGTPEPLRQTCFSHSTGVTGAEDRAEQLLDTTPVVRRKVDHGNHETSLGTEVARSPDGPQIRFLTGPRSTTPSRYPIEETRMDVKVAENFFGLLAILANIAALAAIVLAVASLWPAGRDLRDYVALVLRPVLLPLLVVVSLTTMGGSLYFSEVVGYTPCRYCWFARIALYPLSALFLTALALRSKAATVRPFAVPLAAVAIVVSGYHYLLEWFPTWETSACDLTAPCTSVWFRSFGFVSLAYMSVSAGAVVLALVWLWRCADRAEGELVEGLELERDGSADYDTSL